MACFVSMLLCIILFMPAHSFHSQALALARTIRKLGLTQAELATALDASQPQISRILRGHLQRRSRLFDELCVYVRSLRKGVTPSAVRENAELIDALAATWDGTAQHAAALAGVIRSLGALQKQAPPIKSDRNHEGVPHADR